MIAKKAGLTRGAIYWHFENKFSILKELANIYMEKIFNNLYHEFEINKSNSIDKISALFNIYFNSVLNNKKIMKFRKIIEFKISYTGETVEIKELFNKFIEGMTRNLNLLIKLGQENKEIRSDMDSDFLTIFIISWILGYENLFLSSHYSIEINLNKNVVIENMIKFMKDSSK